VVVWSAAATLDQLHQSPLQLMQLMQLMQPLQVLQIQYDSCTLHTFQGVQRGIFTMLSQSAFNQEATHE
jgi:hypothetical protein